MENNSNPKGFNNPKDWEKIESKDINTKVINDEENFYVQEDNIEIIEGEDIFEEENQDFSEVIELTPYNEQSGVANTNNNYIIAEYKEIDTEKISDKHQIEAQKFVTKITKFVLEFNDVTLTEEHKKYLVQVGKFQVQHLSDLLSLTSINKLMLNNIIARVNATQAEDYAVINAYNNLANQHLKLIKELQNTYKSIPSTLKKMRTEIICNQEIEENEIDNELITKDINETQFNNGKQMLKNILEKRNEKLNKKIV